MKKIENKNIEEKVPFAFGNLIELPGLKSRLLQSNSRIYVPEINEWASVDSELIWNPEVILNHPGNWNGLEYASGDSVNNLDVEGRFTKWFMGIAVTSGIFGSNMFKSFDKLNSEVEKLSIENEKINFKFKEGKINFVEKEIKQFENIKITQSKMNKISKEIITEHYLNITKNSKIESNLIKGISKVGKNIGEIIYNRNKNKEN